MHSYAKKLVSFIFSPLILACRMKKSGEMKRALCRGRGFPQAPPVWVAISAVRRGTTDGLATKIQGPHDLPGPQQPPPFPVLLTVDRKHI